MVHLISTQSQHVSVNRDHIKHLTMVLHQMIRAIQADRTTIKLEAGTIYIQHICSKLKVLMGKYLSIIQAASIQRLATNAISAFGATEALNEIEKMAKQKGLKPIITKIGHLHQLPTSFSVTKFGL